MGRRLIYVFISILYAIALPNCEEKPSLNDATHDTKPNERFGNRAFNSEISLSVWIIEKDNNVGITKTKKIGQTPSKDPIEIPGCLCWFVQASDNVDWSALAGEMRKKWIPGLDAPNKTGDKELALIQDLQNLQRLDLSYTKVTNDGLRHLQGLEKLWRLDLVNAKVTGEGLRYLHGLGNLRVLYLGCTNTNDEGLRHLQELKNLQVLSLMNTDITDKGLYHLRKLQNLRELSLGGTKVTGKGIYHLWGLQNLKVLHLWNTEITSSGLRHLPGLSRQSHDMQDARGGGLHLVGDLLAHHHDQWPAFLHPFTVLLEPLDDLALGHRQA